MNRPRLGLLVLGVAMVALGELRFGIGWLAVLAPVPFLVHARREPSLARAAWVVPAYAVAWTLATMKIVTAPLPLAIALGYGVPLGLARGLAVLVHRALAARLSPRLGWLGFPVALTLLDFAQHAATPLGTWGAGAYAALDSLPMLQLVAFAGFEGLSFVLYVIAALVAELALAAPEHRSLAMRRLVCAVGVVGAVFALGCMRLAVASESTVPTVRVAAIDTDATFRGLPLPSSDETERVERGLEARTRVAAAAGAKLVVFTEASTLVERRREPRFLAWLAELARETRTYVVAGYVVPTSLDPLHYENVYALATPDGRIDHRQAKRQPVPGEPADRGAPPPPVVRTPFGSLSGAICYDYDFPRVALDHGRRSVDIVALPSSDWRGIDPLHTEMAAVRAIENGHSIVRAARFGLHGIVDPVGRFRAVKSHFEPGDGILLAEVPSHGVRTLHARLGDAPMAIVVALAVVLGAAAMRRRVPARAAV